MQEVLELDPEDNDGKYRSMDKWAAQNKVLHAAVMGSNKA